MRDIVLADTVFMAFTTRAFATGIPTVLAGTPVVSAYEDAGLTQITAGITLGVDHDSVVGLNMLTIVATGANGYEADKDYNLVITTGTVGGVSVVGEVVGQFSIQRAPVNWANVTDPTTALDLSGTDIQLVDTTTVSTDAEADIAALNDVAATDIVSAGAITTLSGAIVNVDLVDTTTTNTDMRGTDSAATAAALATVDSNVDAILVDTADMQPKLGSPVTDISADIAVIDANVDQLELGIIFGAAATGTLSTTQATSDLTGFTDDQFIGRVIIFTAGPADGEATDITDYASASGLLTFTALTLAPENGNAFKIV